MLALLCAAVAVAAARELSQAKITVTDLPKQLQELNTRCVPALPAGPFCCWSVKVATLWSILCCQISGSSRCSLHAVMAPALFLYWLLLGTPV